MKRDTSAIKKSLQNWLSSDEYARMLNRPSPLPPEEAEKSVFVHHSTQGASLLPTPNLSFVC